MSVAATIRRDIEEHVRSGRWPPGHRIPVERELADRYRCSRATVSKAVSELVSAGLIVRRRRAGSFVAPPRVRSAVLEIPDIPAVVAARGSAHEFALLGRRVRPLDTGDADEALLAVAGDALELEGLHRVDGAPFAFERRVIALATIPAAHDADFAAVSPGSWLLRHVPWTDARHRIAAVPAGAAAARLGVPPAAACLRVQRWTWRAGAGVTFVAQLFPGDRYDLVSDFGPEACRRKAAR